MMRTSAPMKGSVRLSCTCVLMTSHCSIWNARAPVASGPDEPSGSSAAGCGRSATMDCGQYHEEKAMISITIARDGEQLDEIIFDDKAGVESTSGVYRDVVRDCANPALWRQVAHVAQIVASRGHLPRSPGIDVRREAEIARSCSVPDRGQIASSPFGETLQRDVKDGTVSIKGQSGRLDRDLQETTGSKSQRSNLLPPPRRGLNSAFWANVFPPEDSVGKEREVILLEAAKGRAKAKEQCLAREGLAADQDLEGLSNSPATDRS